MLVSRTPYDGAALAWLPAALAIGACACTYASQEISANHEALTGGKAASPTAWENVLWLETGCTAVLVHERVVVYAAHCGIDHERVWVGQRFDVRFDAGAVKLDGQEHYRSLEIERCAIYPGSDGAGADLAYCILAVPVLDIAPVPPLARCERAIVRVGETVTLVGFGFAEDGDVPGIKRVGTSSVRSLDSSFIAGDDQVGTCRGDSGGPALIAFDSARGLATWRVFGVLSSGKAGTCGPGRYADLSAATAWLESASGFDLTPCTDAGGAWRPGPQCIKPPLDADGEPSPGLPQYADTCGTPYSPGRGCSAVTVRDGFGCERGPSGAIRTLWIALALCILARRKCLAVTRSPFVSGDRRTSQNVI